MSSAVAGEKSFSSGTTFVFGRGGGKAVLVWNGFAPLTVRCNFAPLLRRVVFVSEPHLRATVARVHDLFTFDLASCYL